MRSTSACKIFPICLLAPALAAAEDAIPLFRAETRVVALHATALNAEGTLRLGLPRSAFKVYEDGVPQRIDTFHGGDVPVSLGFLLDTSASMSDKREAVSAASKAVLEQFRAGDEFFVVRFSEQAYVVEQATADRSRLREWMAPAGTSGETAVRDALRVGIDYVSGRRKDKRVLLLVTDGCDNRSLETMERVIRSAQQEEVVIFAVIFQSDDPREAELAKRGIDALSSSTGGQAYYPKNVREFLEIAPRIASEIRNQYTITYRPVNRAEDGVFHQIRVVVDNPPSVTVRTRTGYYARRLTGAD